MNIEGHPPEKEVSSKEWTDQNILAGTADERMRTVYISSGKRGHVTSGYKKNKTENQLKVNDTCENRA